MGREWVRRLCCDVSPEPECAAATIAVAQAGIGPGATAWGVGAADRAARASLARGYAGEPPAALVGPVRRACEACVLALLDGLLRGVPTAEVAVPVEAMESARDAVRAGLPLERLLRTMWNAHVSTVDALLQDLRGPLGGEVWTDEAREVGHLSFAYLDAFSEWMVREYNAEREAWVGSVAAARRELVAAVLDRRPVEPAEAERTLGIRLTGPLLPVIVWSERGVPVPDHEVLAFVAALGRAADADAALTVQGGPSVVWAWFPLRVRPAEGLARRLRAAVDPPVGLSVAVGPAYTGLAGLRRGHLAARRACVLARVAGSWLVEYREVAALSLLTADMEEAACFAADVLGGLAGDDERTRILQATLRAYLASGRSRRTAAAQLHVAPGTVAYRVRQAEALLGRPVEGVDRDVALALDVEQVRRALRT